MYKTRREAIDAGVALEHLTCFRAWLDKEALVALLTDRPELTVSSGPFKRRPDKRTVTGLVRVR